MTNTITVVNVKTAQPGTFVYCGRYNSTYKLQASPLANSFKLTREGCRQTLLVLYRCRLYKQLQTNTPQRREIERIAILLETKNVNLGCWCKQPNREVACHCDVIAAFVRRECARRAAVAAMRQKPTTAPPKRNVSGLETVAGDGELGPMFEVSE
jgi:hypothetical protein